MKIGKRQQQGRGTTQKTPCPSCNEHYLEPFRNSRMEKKGTFCPNPECEYCKKI
jgi:hypothetical protein